MSIIQFKFVTILNSLLIVWLIVVILYELKAISQYFARPRSTEQLNQLLQTKQGRYWSGGHYKLAASVEKHWPSGCGQDIDIDAVNRTNASVYLGIEGADIQSILHGIDIEGTILSSKNGNPWQPLKNYRNPCWISYIPESDPYHRNHYYDKVEHFNNGRRWNASEVFKKMTGIYKKRLIEGDMTRVRCLPYVYIIGVTKSGTTDLYSNLLSHPDVVPGAIKEPLWWNRMRLGCDRHKSTRPYPLQDYIDLFDEAAYAIQNNDNDHEKFHNKITVDASPAYMWDYDGWQMVPGNRGLKEPKYTMAHSLYTLVPQAKIIVILRNPVDRLYSHFRMWWPAATQMEFQTVAKAALERMTECLHHRTVRSCAYDSNLITNEVKKPGRIYLRASMYAVFLSDWLAVYPSEQLHVVRAEDYYSNRTDVIKNIVTFLELPPLSDEILSNLSKSEIVHQRWDSGPLAQLPMLKQTRSMLENFFEPLNSQLAEMLHDKGFLWKSGS